jgi:hypothetical protein
MRTRITILAVTTALVGLVVAATLTSGAGAQTAVETLVISDLTVVPNNGHVTFPPSSGGDAGTLGVACTGARPRSGANIPGQVVTTLDSDATRLRVIRNTGTAISGVSVAVNCVVQVEVGSAAESRFRQLASR